MTRSEYNGTYGSELEESSNDGDGILEDRGEDDLARDDEGTVLEELAEFDGLLPPRL